MLTTRCPNCSTMFRIRPEQLTVRSGRVRCGSCQQAFSALNHLEEVDDEMVLPSNPVPSAQAAKPVALATGKARSTVPQPAVPLNASLGVAAELPASLPTPSIAPVAEPEPTESEKGSAAAPEAAVPLSTRSAEPADATVGLVLKGPSPAEVRTEAKPDFAFDFDVSGLANDAAPAGHVEPFTAAEHEASAAEVPAKPYESKIAKELGIPAYDPERATGFGKTVMLEEPVELTRQDVDEASESGNSSEARKSSRRRSRKSRKSKLVEDRRKRRHTWKWALGSGLLGLLALAQGAYVFRTEVVRELPQLRAPFEQVCLQLGCSVPYPREASDEKIKIESSEFFADGGGPGRYRLVATIANHVPYAQAWPSLEVTITDRFDIAIARRVLAPNEWLPAAKRKEPAFEPHSEVAANIALDLGGLAASGYRLYVFYP